MRKLLDALTRNWKLKLLALSLALLLWVMVTTDEPRTGELSVPLSVQVADPAYRVDPASVPQNVTVRLSGRGAELADLATDRRRPPLQLRMGEIEDTVQVVFLSPDMVDLPAGSAVRVLSVSPDALRLRFTRVGSRTVRVRPRIGNPPPPGHMLVDSLTVTPPEVFVRGPVSQIARLDTIYTNPIDLSETDSVFTRNVRLDTSGLDAFELAVDRVDVSGRVDRVLEREFTEVPISVGSGMRVVPRSVDVTLRGPESILAQMQPQDLRVAISIDSIPRSVPPDGLLVPLRIERLRPGVQAEPQPRTARLFPAAAATDSLPGAPTDTAAAAAEDNAESPADGNG